MNEYFYAKLFSRIVDGVEYKHLYFMLNVGSVQRDYGSEEKKKKITKRTGYD